MALVYERLGELFVALREIEPALHQAVKEGLREVGEVVRDDAEERFAEYDASSAAGFRVRVRAAGRVVVEQTRRRTTGRRPDYGSLMMTKALLPARDAKEAEAAEVLEARVGRTLEAAGF